MPEESLAFYRSWIGLPLVSEKIEFPGRSTPTLSKGLTHGVNGADCR